MERYAAGALMVEPDPVGAAGEQERRQQQGRKPAARARHAAKHDHGRRPAQASGVVAAPR
jgi:hypothetical protein